MTDQYFSVVIKFLSSILNSTVKRRLISSVSGLAPGQAPPGVPMPPVPLPQGLPQPMPPPQLPDSLQEDRSDEPYAKRSRMDGDNELMGEQEFLATHPSPVTFKVQVPEMREKTEWRCHGQALMFTLPLTDQVLNPLHTCFSISI